jgi:hypothetical protein
MIRRLNKTPSLRGCLDDPDWWTDACNLVSAETGIGMDKFPRHCPWATATEGSPRRHRSFHPAQGQSRQARRVGRRRFRGIGYLVIKNRCLQHNCACWLEEDPSDSTLLVWRSNFQAGIGELSYACSRRSSVEEALRVHGQPGIFNNDQARSSPAKPSPACSSLAARGRSQGLATRIAYGQKPSTI